MTVTHLQQHLDFVPLAHKSEIDPQYLEEPPR